MLVMLLMSPVAAIEGTWSSPMPKVALVLSGISNGSAFDVAMIVSLSSRNDAFAARCVTSFAASIALTLSLTALRSFVDFGRKYE